MTPIIFDGPLETIPKGFNAALIPLDGRMRSDLNWKHSIGKAEEAVSEGLMIFWDLDLGLFDRLLHPLSHETQFQTLSLALDHFYQSIWHKFSENSIGIALYRGALIGDVELDFLNLLIPSLPQTLDPYLLLDASGISDPLMLAKLLDNACYDRFKRAIKGSVIPHREIQWGESQFSIDFKGFLGIDCSLMKFGEPASVGIYLPHSKSSPEDLRLVLNILDKESILYRLVSEEQLVADWDGLDFLIVSEQCVTPLGKRKLLGFSAAGGHVVTIKGESIGVPLEITLTDWLSNR